MVKILVITDDSALVEALSECSIFQSQEARVDWHQMGRIDDLTPDDYDLFVIDSHMEGIDGPALISQILDFQPNALTLFVADPEQDELIVPVLRAGAYDFITRPISPDYLMASLRRVDETIRFRELNRSKDELLAGIWHALRTPLNTTLNWAQLLRTEQLDKSTAQLAVEMIERGAREYAQLLQRFEGLSLALTPPRLPTSQLKRNLWKNI